MNDKLTVILQGVRGGKHKVSSQGKARLVVQKYFNAPSSSIEVDVFKGTADNYQPRGEALIYISFSNGKQFTGTFEDLRKAMNL